MIPNVVQSRWSYSLSYCSSEGANVISSDTKQDIPSYDIRSLIGSMTLLKSLFIETMGPNGFYALKPLSESSMS